MLKLAHFVSGEKMFFMAGHSPTKQSQHIRYQGQQAQNPPPSRSQQKATNGSSTQQPPLFLVNEVLRLPHALPNALTLQFENVAVQVSLRDDQTFAGG
jgi:hypothetical protein